MKGYFLILKLLILVGSLLFIVACGSGGSGKTETQSEENSSSNATLPAVSTDSCLLNIYLLDGSDKFSRCSDNMDESVCGSYEETNASAIRTSSTSNQTCAALEYSASAKYTQNGATWYEKSLSDASNALAIISMVTVTDAGVSIADILLPTRNIDVNVISLTGKDTQLFLDTTSGLRSVTNFNISSDKRSINFNAPEDVTDGKLIIFDNNENIALQDYIVYNSQTPYVSQITPDIGMAGDAVTLTGENLPQTSIDVVFQDQNSSLTQSIKPIGNSLSFTIPTQAESGNIYLKIGDMQTNPLYLSVKKAVNVEVVLANALNLESYDISFILGLKEYVLDSDFTTKLNVENNAIQYINAILDQGAETDAALLYNAVVLPDMSDAIVVDANSTAIAWIFMGMSASATVEKDKLRALYDKVASNAKVQEFANYISTLQKSDFNAWATVSDDTLKTKFQDALRDIIQTEQTNKAATRSLKAQTIDPNTVLITQEPANSNIYITDSVNVLDPWSAKLNDGTIRIINDTKLYLSVEVRDKKHNQIINGYAHAKDSILTNGGTLISPEGWGFLYIATSKTLRLDGKDAHIEIITPSWNGKTDKESISNSLRKRVWIEGLAVPTINILLTTILNRRMKNGYNPSHFISAMRDIYGPSFGQQLTTQISSVDNSWGAMADTLIAKPFINGINGCFYSIGGSCNQFAAGVAGLLGVASTKDVGKQIIGMVKDAALKSLGKKAVAVVPVIGQIATLSIFVYDNISYLTDGSTILGTLAHMKLNPREINVEVDFPLEVTKVRPTCVAISSSKVTQPFVIDGNGFLDVDDVFPDVTIDAGENSISYEDVTVSSDGANMIAAFNAQGLIYAGSWDTHLFVNHLGQRLMYDEPIRMISQDDAKIYFDGISPQRAMLGQTITLTGCGWVPLDEIKVHFTKKGGGEAEGEIVSKSMDKIEVKVPSDAKNGLIYVTSGQKETEKKWFDVIPFGVFNATPNTFIDAFNISINGQGLNDASAVYFKDNKGTILEGSINNITASGLGMEVKAPSGLEVGPVALYVLLKDGIPSNQLAITKIPQSPTADPINVPIGNEGITVSLTTQETDADIYYWIDEGEKQLYGAPINLTLESMTVSPLTLHAITRMRVDGANYDSDQANVTGYDYDACKEGETMNADRECAQENNQSTTWENWPNPQWCPMTVSGYSYIHREDRDGDGSYEFHVYCYYYDSGQINNEMPNVDGTQNGIRKYYYESGQLRDSVLMIGDKLNGIKKGYYESGKLEYERPYSNGKINGVAKYYYESGQVRYEKPYTNDELNGITKYYYESGQLEYESSYVDDMNNGIFKYYYESGQVKYEQQYADGVVNGVMKSYYESGCLYKEATYDNGNYVSQIYYNCSQ